MPERPITLILWNRETDYKSIFSIDTIHKMNYLITETVNYRVWDETSCLGWEG